MLFLAVMVSGSLMAMGTVKVNVVPWEKGKAVVSVLDAPNQKVKIELKDNNGGVIYTESNDSPSYDFRTAIDLSKLDNGKYTFEVTLGDETAINNLVLNDGNIQIVDQEEQITPSFTIDGKFLRFSFPNSEEKGVRLLLYNTDTNDLVFQESLNPEFDIKQSLNLSSLDLGSYKAVLLSEKNIYDYDFQLN